MYFSGSTSPSTMSSTTCQAQHVLECECKNPVEFFCKRCKVSLCEACLPVHTRLKTIYGHAIIEYITDDDEGLTTNCTQHSGHDCEAFCEPCRIPVCLLCVSFEHKSHVISELTDKIPELLEDIMRENQRLESLEFSYKRMLKYVIERNGAIRENYQNLTDDIRDRILLLKQEIEKEGNKLLQELTKLEKEHLDLLELQRVEFHEKLKQLLILRGKISTKQKTENALKLLDMERDVNSFHSAPQIRDATIPSMTSRFKIEGELKRYFGVLDVPEKYQVCLPCTESTNDPVRIVSPPRLTATIDTRFPPRLSKNCLFDLVYMRGNRVWVGGSTPKLKLFDFCGNLLDIKPIESECGLYMTLYKGKVVFNNYVFNRLEMMEDVPVDQISTTCMFDFGICYKGWSASGIASTRSGNFLVCMKQNELAMKIVRFNRNGTQMQEIQFDFKNRPLYKKLVYVAENGNGDVCAVDWGRKGIVVTDEGGKYRFSYHGISREDSLIGGSLTTDSFCNILIADCLADKIHVIDKDGFFLLYITLPDLNCPRALSVTDDGELLVGECRSGLVKCIKYFK